MKHYLKKILIWLFTFPEFFFGGFLTFHLRPKLAKKVSIAPTNPQDLSKYAIVIQGPIITKNNFTLETIRLYKYFFSGSVIVLSTWDDVNEEVIKRFNEEKISVILNKKPESPGQQNINYQIISSRSGVEKAAEMGCEYVLKTRTDQRIYNPNTLEFFRSMLKNFPININSCQQKARIIGVSLNTFKYRLYGLSDTTIFGSIDDMLLYWNADLDEREKGVFEPFNYLKLSLCEVYLATKFLINIGREIKWTLKDSWEVFIEHFCIIDEKSIDLYWYKYARIKEFRYRSYMHQPEKEELTFADWVVLYSNFKNLIIPTNYDLV
jgi:hypothetical protein